MAKKKEVKTPNTMKKQVRISQSDIPKYSFRECIKLVTKLYEELNGTASPHQLAIALSISPTSSAWQYITGASVAYGLTVGGYNAKEIKLSNLGKKIIAPTEENEDLIAKAESALKPKIISKFFKKYNKGKFPSDKIAENVLESMGVPRSRVTNVLKMIKEIGEDTGIVHQTTTGKYVAIDTPSPKKDDSSEIEDENEEGNNNDTEMEEFAKNIANSGQQQIAPKTEKEEDNNRVFITHGKNKSIVSQLKELLTFGKFEPVVSVDKETLSIPVPEKVMADMRSCSAAVIHVEGEGEVLDPKGKKHIHINSNVLIEIGAAMALYEKNFVLLVHKGVQLPSNLQGLYRCEYEGDSLNYESTMKLLKTFNEFK